MCELSVWCNRSELLCCQIIFYSWMWLRPRDMLQRERGRDIYIIFVSWLAVKHAILHCHLNQNLGKHVNCELYKIIATAYRTIGNI